MVTVIPIVIGKGTGRLGNKRMSEVYPYYIKKIGQNTEETPGDLRRLVVTQTPMRNYQLKLVLKSHKRVKM